MGTSVLLIDDEAMVLKAAQLCLRSTGWTVISASDAREGLRLAGTVRPDVIVCDLTMPGMSGTEFIKELRQQPNMAGTPIVLMSGLDQTPLPAGITFLSKPFGPVELRAAIESALAMTPPNVGGA